MINFDGAPRMHTNSDVHVIAEELGTIKSALKEMYKTPYGALVAPSDKNSFKRVQDVVLKIQKKNPSLVVLIGIGGSNMGTLAVMDALRGSFYNEHNPAIRFYCADTIDNDRDASLLLLMEKELKKGGCVVLCIVTKSGATAETIINGAVCIDLLKRYRPTDYHECVVAITDTGSPLMTVAQQNGYELLEIPPLIGGRYSVFTAVGLFPLMLMGIDVEAFCKGAQQMLESSLDDQSEAALSALTLNSHYQSGIVIHDIFPFSPDLLLLGAWYKQLIGESLGKKNDQEGRVVEIGMTPTVSAGTVDLHSVVQLYLGGPRNRITTFIVSEEPENLIVPDNVLSALIPGLGGKSVTFIKKAIFQGVTAAYTNEKRPFMVADLQHKGSAQLGSFMMMKMIETILLARLFNINAFDQPAVELYKKETRTILRKHF